MSITTYATVTQFLDRHPPTMLGARTVADVAITLVTASGDMDDFFRGVFPLPFARVGVSVSRRCVDHAWWLFMGGRGFDPQADADQEILTDEKSFQEWMDKVQRRVIFPDVDIDPTATIAKTFTSYGSTQPMVLSSSVIDVTTGQTACNRGW